MDAMGTSEVPAAAKRQHGRFRASIRGSVQYLGATYPCVVENVSEHGLFLRSSAVVGVGGEVNLDLLISQSTHLTCVAEVRHVTNDGVGGQIVSIPDSGSKALGQLIEALYPSAKDDR